MLRRSELQLRAEPQVPAELVLLGDGPRLLSRGSLAVAVPGQREALPDRVEPATFREALPDRVEPGTFREAPPHRGTQM